MGWRDNRRRSICKKIMFAPEEWEQARRIHERWARNIPVYRRWGDFARQTLMHGASMNVSVTLASAPEVFKAGAPPHRREREPDSPLRWPDWWILLTATTHPVYLLAIAPKISRFITGGQR